MAWAKENRVRRDAGLYNDWSHGGAGNDYLYGKDGEDYLDGGSGGARLTGGDGNDTYVYTEESHDLAIYDTGYGAAGTDRLVMHEGISPGDVIPWREGNSLYLYVRGGEDIISVSSHFADDSSGIDQVVFADGTVWDRSYYTDSTLRFPL
jgi:Ca2+-binding RTX toxin-like protein